MLSLSAFALFPDYAGIWKYDLDCVREFNFIIYLNQKLSMLKILSFDTKTEDMKTEDMKTEDMKYIEKLVNALELAIGALMNVANDILEPRRGIGFSLRGEIPLHVRTFYHLVCSQQHLFLIAELLVQLNRIKVKEFRLEETENLIKKYTTAEQYKKYLSLYGTDGLFDMILNQANVLYLLEASLTLLMLIKPCKVEFFSLNDYSA